MSQPRIPVAITPPKHRLAALIGPAVAALGLGGCVVVPVPLQYGYGAPAYDVANVPPPAPQYEAVGVAPYPGAVWITGYWGWSNGRYMWNRGYWHAPRPGYRWAPHRWVQQGGGWRAQGGRWERR